MSQHDEEPLDADRAWQAIVDNYGDRVVLDDEPDGREPGQVSASTPDAPSDPPSDLIAAAPGPPADREPAAAAEERFVPPPPPPLPRPAPPRAVAWAGIFGVPLIVLVSLFASVQLPRVLDYLLLSWFVGGFVYLVATMSRSPRDPWDDGSRV